MNSEPVWLGDTNCPEAAISIDAEYTTVDGQRWAVIRNVDAMPPFLMSIVSRGDMWLFAGSNGAFTAGRVNPDGALFPYQTADKILRSPDSGGALTVMLVRKGDRRYLWEPWQPNGRVYRLKRSLHKHEFGTAVAFEEVNEDLGLSFRWTLAACDGYGLVRECCLRNTGPEPVDVQCLDGWRRLNVPGVSPETFQRFSYLAEGYMRHERAPDLPLGLFTLNAGLADSADPCESLRATAAWSHGHRNPVILLCERQVEAFRRGVSPEPEGEIRGETGAFLAADSFRLEPGGKHEWLLAADTGLDHAAVARLEEELRSPNTMAASVREDLAGSRDGVRALAAAADGLQSTADRSACTHHFANVLFNCMRGGTFAGTERVDKGDFGRFLHSRNKAIAVSHRAWLDALPDNIGLAGLHREAAKTGDAQLLRLTREYLPLTFSRRHGDPSRPWNYFTIHTRDEAGQPVFAYEGNWRDIFQNWEALAQSYPNALDAMISVFLNASTADGYNPYRITREGIDWEVQNPHDPWSSTGYWGDHQIVYLLRLLQSAERYHPGRLASGLREQAYSYAQVPYEIAGFDAILNDPRHTIRFNHELHARLLARADAVGGDGKLLQDPDGSVMLVSLVEKLLAPLLAKLSNLVPGGGVWLNTQRPEWNDANNALAGWGLSVVTVHYMRRYIAFMLRILDGAGEKPFIMSAPTAKFLDDIHTTIAATGLHWDDGVQFRSMILLGRSGEKYRNTLYREGLTGRTVVPVSDIRDFLLAALKAVEATLHANRREDGMFHSYNVLMPAGGDRASIKRLSLMLEGQVAALSSGILPPSEALSMLRVLRNGELYQPDRKSYILYPDRLMTPYSRRNLLPEDAVRRAPVLQRLADAGNVSLATLDVRGNRHFNGSLRNARDLNARLDELAKDEAWREDVERDRQAVLDLWEDVFRHSEFTGRSGTFFMFEGLGSIYWHMVAKLLLAVQECWRSAVEQGGDAAVVRGLAEAYEEIRDGLGYRKTPAEYGAFPTDPYSHSPAHRGAQQPGMTGQVKEEILSRWGELGVEVRDGMVRFAPRLLSRSEFSGTPFPFKYLGLDGADATWDLPADSLAFTFCQIPVCYRLGDLPGITVVTVEGDEHTLSGDLLSVEESASIFERRGTIRRISVTVCAADLRP